MKKKLLVVLVLLLVGGGLAYKFQEQIMVALGLVEVVDAKDDLRLTMDSATLADAAQITAIAPAADDKVVDLSAEETSVAFIPYKHVAGNLATVSGGWEKDQITGKAICSADGKSIKQLQVEINAGGLWSEQPMLTEALIKRGFFRVEEHPKVTFISKDFKPVSSSKLAGATHQVSGNLTINGQTKLITFPAMIDAAGEKFKFKSEFTIERKPFDLNYTDPWPGMSLKDENIDNVVAMKITVNTGSGEDAGKEIIVSNEPVNVEGLPNEMTVEFEFTNRPFEFVLVKGDAAKGIKPFYISKYETTWDQFMYWAFCEDLDPAEAGKQRNKNLRPSQPYQDIDRGYGFGAMPALSMSWLSAELYCKFLSKRKGMLFRLPTEAEWNEAYKEGGYDPATPLTEEQANEMAVWLGNSENPDLDDKFTPRKVGSMKPNKLGIYDMAGNVAEWVTDTGEERVARGGHFDGNYAEFGGELEYQGPGRAIEDQDVWNETYPNYPKSIWWYVEAQWVGFRVVLDAGSVAATTATPTTTSATE